MKKQERHRKICEELNDLYSRKNADYGDSFSKSYAEFGPVMSAIRLGDKLTRVKALVRGRQQVNDESVRDTLMDLANYAIMTVIEMDIQEDSIGETD